jgi:hypothetical protein
MPMLRDEASLRLREHTIKASPQALDAALLERMGIERQKNRAKARSFFRASHMHRGLPQDAEERHATLFQGVAKPAPASD